MKAIVVTEPGKWEFKELEKSEISTPTDVLIRVKAIGVCGSDIHIYHGTNPFAKYPRVIGHEIAGEVVSVGKSVNHLKPGMKVAVAPSTGCGQCYACKKGRTNVCKNVSVKGVHEDGGMQEYMVSNASNVHPVDEAMSFEDIALVEPFTIGAQSTKRAGIEPGDTALIMGAGPIGLTVLLAAKIRGAKVAISDIDDFCLQNATSLGADMVINPAREDLFEKINAFTDDYGVNAVIDAACVPQLLEQALECASPAGRVVVLGFSESPSAIAQVNITKKELDVCGSRLQAGRFPEVIEWIEKGLIDPSVIKTHTFPASEFGTVLDLVENKTEKVGKIVLTF